MVGAGTAQLGGRRQYPCFKESPAHSRRSRNGQLTSGSQWPGSCTLPPSHRTRWHAEAAHTDFRGVSASNDTHFHNKEARLRGATSPRRNRGAQWEQRVRSLPSRRDAPGVSSGAVPVGEAARRA